MAKFLFRNIDGARRDAGGSERGELLTIDPPLSSAKLSGASWENTSRPTIGGWFALGMVPDASGNDTPRILTIANRSLWVINDPLGGLIASNATEYNNILPQNISQSYGRDIYGRVRYHRTVQYSFRGPIIYNNSRSYYLFRLTHDRTTDSDGPTYNSWDYDLYELTCSATGTNWAIRRVGFSRRSSSSAPRPFGSGVKLGSYLYFSAYQSSSRSRLSRASLSNLNNHVSYGEIRLDSPRLFTDGTTLYAILSDDRPTPAVHQITFARSPQYNTPHTTTLVGELPTIGSFTRVNFRGFYGAVSSGVELSLSQLDVGGLSVADATTKVTPQVSFLLPTTSVGGLAVSDATHVAVTPAVSWSLPRTVVGGLAVSDATTALLPKQPLSLPRTAVGGLSVSDASLGGVTVATVLTPDRVAVGGVQPQAPRTKLRLPLSLPPTAMGGLAVADAITALAIERQPLLLPQTDIGGVDARDPSSVNRTPAQVLTPARVSIGQIELTDASLTAERPYVTARPARLRVGGLSIGDAPTTNVTPAVSARVARLSLGGVAVADGGLTPVAPQRPLPLERVDVGGLAIADPQPMRVIPAVVLRAERVDVGGLAIGDAPTTNVTPAASLLPRRLDVGRVAIGDATHLTVTPVVSLSLPRTALGRVKARSELATVTPQTSFRTPETDVGPVAVAPSLLRAVGPIIPLQLPHGRYRGHTGYAGRPYYECNARRVLVAVAGRCGWRGCARPA